MGKNLNKEQITEKLNADLDRICEVLQSRKVGCLQTITMGGLMNGIQGTLDKLESFGYTLKQLRKDASPLTDTEQLLYDAYKDIDSNGFEGGGGLNAEQCKEYDRLDSLLNK